MQVQSINNQNNNFRGLLTIKKQTNMLHNIYRIKPLRTQRLQEVTLNTDFIASVEALPKRRAVPALRNNIIINLVNGVKYKITGCATDDIFIEKWKKAHLNNSEEYFYL